MHEVTLQAGAWLYGVHRTCADTAADSRGTSHVTTKQHCELIHYFDEYSETRNKRLQSLIQNPELGSCEKVEVAVLGSPSLIVRTVSVDVKQHGT